MCITVFAICKFYSMSYQNMHKFFFTFSFYEVELLLATLSFGDMTGLKWCLSLLHTHRYSLLRK